MNEEIETAILAYLDTLSAFDGVALRTGTSASEGTTQTPTVICAVEDLPHIVGNVYTASLALEVRTVSLASTAATTHTTLVAALVDVFTDNLTALTTSFNAASPHAIRGAFIRNAGVKSQDNDRFVTRLDVTVGIAKDAAS
jgi:hypothetical protein